MQPPAVSWGLLLIGAQKKMGSVAQQPWMLLPSIFVVVVVLTFNFIGDGLRAAADPYAS